MKEHWTLDPSIAFLNHGSFGATPRAVLEVQRQYRDQMEAEPVRFMIRELEPLLDSARDRLATFLGTTSDALAFVPNATTGVNSVTRSLQLQRGDELLTTSHEYNASKNALEHVAAEHGARVITVPIPLPLPGDEEIVDLILGAVTPRTRLLLIDHITSPTGVILPVRKIVDELNQRGIDTLVDGAHAPGMLPLELDELGAAYYTGNLHKWVCAPKGAAFLHVREDRRASVRPAVISHGANSDREGRSRYHVEFDWTGTFDPSPWLSIPAAIDFMGSLLPGGWEALRLRNHQLVLTGRDLLLAATRSEQLAPDEALGSLAAIRLPDGAPPRTPAPPIDPLQDLLFFRYGIEVPIHSWPAAPSRLIRISAQIYNEPSEYERLAQALLESL